MPLALYAFAQFTKLAGDAVNCRFYDVNGVISERPDKVIRLIARFVTRRISIRNLREKKDVRSSSKMMKRMASCRPIVGGGHSIHTFCHLFRAPRQSDETRRCVDRRSDLAVIRIVVAWKNLVPNMA